MLEFSRPPLARNNAIRRRAFEPIRATATSPEPASPGPELLEGYAKLLEESGAFRILRRLVPRPPAPMFEAPNAQLALFVDVETTGLDPTADEVIELAVVPFSFASSGRILAVHEPVSQLREPSRPIPPQVTQLTGIDDEEVRGRRIDEAALRPLLAAASLVVAHNAQFDRPFLERLMPEFADLPWSCSLAEVPWRDQGLTSLALPAIAAHCGFFYDAHRATDDCLAAIEVLGRPLARTGGLAMAELVRRAAAETCRVWAVGSPFEAKDVLKRRGYKWSNGQDGRARAWHADVDAAQLDAELRFLREEVGLAGDLPVTRLTAYERFSSRA